MSKDWKIKNGTMVHGGSNKSQLVGCSIELDTTTNTYGFFGPLPHRKLEASVPPDVFGRAAKPPFNFPMFRSPLNGRDSHDWYIQLSTTDNLGPDQAAGFWSNKRYHEYPVEADPETFTAQAGVGMGDDEGDDAAAAAASSKS